MEQHNGRMRRASTAFWRVIIRSGCTANPPAHENRRRLGVMPGACKFAPRAPSACALLHGGSVSNAIICTEPCPRPQVGEYDIVIEVGARLLETWESRQFRRDVLLSMALARCGLAGEHFERQAVASGCVSTFCLRGPSR